MNRKSKYITVVTSLFLLLLLTSLSFSLVNDKAGKIDHLLAQYHEYGQLNGTVLVSENGKVIYKKGFGLANVEWDIANQPTTKFRLASITKQFTAMLILQLVQDGKLELDGKMSRYLPEYRKDIADQVTIHHLLNHTSGIPSYTSLPGFMQNEVRNRYPVDEFVAKFCSNDLEFEPGSQFKYNNSGYFLLGAVIEKVSGKPYEEVLKERVFDPIGMKNSGYDHFATVIHNRASGYNKTLAGFVNAPFLEMATPYSAGSLYSTVEDLYLWDQALYTGTLLSTELTERMFTPYLNDYGYGWNVAQAPIGDRSVTVHAHNGGIFGFNTRIVRIVDDRHLIVVLRNAPGGDINQITKNIAAILYDEPTEPPLRLASETVAKTMLNHGVAAALSEYSNLKQNQAESYDFSERGFNRVGYQLLGMKKYREAVEIFKLNVEAYPKSANTYDSLAEAYMTSGNPELALEYYQKTLELLPEDSKLSEQAKESLRRNASEKLEQLRVSSK